uniref:RRM domain-containing protein n=1 Tax=Tetradesmus obliquus TaxID=3088 RepID=A0A383W3L9_TETOB|eukprot:jgi/Sobl393_1/10212/SZX71729.1
MSAVKVLLAGDCLGGFSTLFKKVAAVNSKNGPFDLLLCVGQFFEPGGDGGDIPEQLRQFVDGSAQLPVKTYFLGGYGQGSAATLAALKAAPAGSRSLHYLGRSGVTQLESLNVAFLDGTFHSKAFFAKPPAPNKPPPKDNSAGAEAAAADAAAEPAAEEAEAAEAAAAGDGDGEGVPADAPAAADGEAAAGDSEAAAAAAAPSRKAPAFNTCRHYNQSDVAKLRHQLMVLPGEVDMLLTCEWPAGVLQQLPAGSAAPEGFQPAYASNVAADVALTARPRYHIAGGQALFYARQPYSNPDLGAGPRATRFVGLGSVTGKTPYPAATPGDALAAAAAGSGGSGRAGIGMGSQQQQQQQQGVVGPGGPAGKPAAGKAAGSAAAQKFLHALGLPPASTLSTDVLAALPDGCGASPYQAPGQGSKKRPAEEEGAAIAGSGLPDHCTWRWMPPKRMRGGVPQGATPFQPWGRPGVLKDSARSVFVRNLPFESTYEDLSTFFSQAGEVEDIRRGAQPDSGRANPWCHVQFTEIGAVPAACALNGSLLMGRPVTIATSTPLTKAEGQAPQFERMYAADAADNREGRQQGQQQRRGERRGQQQQRHGQRQQQPLPEPGKPVEGCWFCLSSDQVDVNLVASVGEEVYLALDKGPISPQHCLAIPIEHYPSWAALPAAAAAEAGRYLSALRTAAAAAGQQLVGFERHLKLRSKGGNHCHLNTIGISRAAGETAAEVFTQLASEAGLTLAAVPAVDGQMDMAALRELVGDAEYFLGLLPDGSGLAAPLVPGQRAPMQLGRQILAQLAGVPERADWKECTAAPEAEAEAAEAFRQYFKQYDPAQAAAEEEPAAADAAATAPAGEAPAAAATTEKPAQAAAQD